jgi:hypothetical protein
LLMTGCTWKSKNALTRMVAADHQASALERFEVIEFP